MRTFLLGVLVAGCAPQYFVSDVHHAGGQLIVTKCAFGFDGQPTTSCHDESDGATYGTDGDDELDEAPDPAEVRTVKREVDAPTAIRAAPTGATIAKAFAAKSVRTSLELCRSSYARDVTSLAVSMTVAPSGEITELVTNAPAGQFSECANRALRTANILAYDGAPVHAEQQLAL